MLQCKGVPERQVCDALTIPGIDPYLEDPIKWSDLHFRLIGAISRHLTIMTAPHFYVRVEQRVSIVGPADDERRVIIPDAYLAQAGAPPTQHAASATTIAVPTVITVLDDLELREHYIEIYYARSRAVVATIKVLSPVNKLGGSKRAAFMAQPDRRAQGHHPDEDARQQESDDRCDQMMAARQSPTCPRAHPAR